MGYGQDIIELSPSNAEKFDRILGKTLRAALRQPRRSKGAALLALAGQNTISSKFSTARTQNGIRISNLPENRTIKRFSECKDWHKPGLTANAFQKDMINLIRDRRATKISEEQLEDSIKNYSKIDCKRKCDTIVFGGDRRQITTDIQNSHSSSFLRIFDSFGYYPLLRRKGPRFENLITWLTASTDLYGDLTDRERQSQSDQCRLCGETTESRKHLLAECARTQKLVEEYGKKIEGISQWKSVQFHSLQEDQWLWIIGSGCIPLPEREAPNFRHICTESIFLAGLNVQEGLAKKGGADTFRAWEEFKEIESSIDPDALMAYTDGSRRNESSGAGSVIYHKRRYLMGITSSTQDTSVLYAELYAILDVLRWLQTFQGRDNIQEVHFFIDNMTAVSYLTDTLLPKKHFFLVQEIKHTARSLSSRFRFVTHWIPSHIDRHSAYLLQIHGNNVADKLANEARMIGENGHPGEGNINLIRERIMTESAELLWKIKQLLNPPDGPSADDLSFAHADQVIPRDNLR